MELKLLWKHARAAAIELADGSIFETKTPWEIYINGNFHCKTNRVITILYNLCPDQDCHLQAKKGGEIYELSFRTDRESCTLNVREFGAAGDGVQDDTLFLQAAILACPPRGRVLIPEGTYKITNLYLKNDLTLELSKGAVLLAETDRKLFPVFPGTLSREDGAYETILGTWEGEAFPMYGSILSGFHVHNVTIYGEGTIDGNASRDNWWYEAYKTHTIGRPRMIFLNHCENISILGITVQNSPSWNIHPYFSRDLRFIGLSILGPKDSPNTDGLNPESCTNVEILGSYFSVGDDCIAIKSGKLSMAKKYKVPSSHICIRQCCMRDGHGSITLGSEMAAGINHIQAQQCLFLHTDRGLRIKTRRGRGKDAVIDSVLFEDICMDQVLTPFVINSFYFCEPDGHTDYVQCKNPLPVDDRTPNVKKLSFRNIEARNCHMAAAFFYGLPEQKIEKIEMEHIHVTYAENAIAGQPAMMDHIDTSMCRAGIFAANVKTLILKDIQIQKPSGEPMVLENIDTIIKN